MTKIYFLEVFQNMVICKKAFPKADERRGAIEFCVFFLPLGAANSLNHLWLPICFSSNYLTELMLHFVQQLLYDLNVSRIHTLW